MPYTPNADDATNPTDVVVAETATAEFRALKTKINNMVGLSTSGQSLPALYTTVASLVVAGLPPMAQFITGLGISNNAGAPLSKITVAAGACSDSLGTTFMQSAGGVIDFTIVGAGGLDTGAIAANSWYSLFIIKSAAAVSFIAHLSVAGVAPVPTLPAGYTVYRYIGSVKTDNLSNILAFMQYGQRFIWTQKISSFSTGATVNAIPTAFTVVAPLGIITYPMHSYTIAPSPGYTQGSLIFLGNTTSITTSAAVGNSFMVALSPAANIAGYVSGVAYYESIPTGLSAQLQYYTPFPVALNVFGMGWIDPHVGSTF